MSTNTTAEATAEQTRQERNAGVPEAQPKAERKPDFYDHVLAEEKDPADAARIFAAMNRRKDYALRLIRSHLQAGRRIEDTIAHAFNIAFPKGRDTKNLAA